MTLTREQLQKHWTCIEAFKDGKEIEIYLGDKKSWEYIPYPTWVPWCQYRIKTKKETRYIIIYQINPSMNAVAQFQMALRVYSCKETADIDAGSKGQVIPIEVEVE